MPDKNKPWLADANRKLLNIIAGVIAIGLLTLTVLMVVVILFIPIPSENESLVGQAFGTVLGLVSIVVAFFFGTNTTSKQDRDTINSLAEKATKTDSTVVGRKVSLDPGEQVKVEAKNE